MRISELSPAVNYATRDNIVLPPELAARKSDLETQAAIELESEETLASGAGRRPTTVSRANKVVTTTVAIRS